MGVREVAFFITAGKKLFDGNGVRTTVLGGLCSYDGVLYLRCTEKTDILRLLETFFSFHLFLGPVDLGSIPVSISILITQANPPSPLSIGTWQEIIHQSPPIDGHAISKIPNPFC